MRAVRRDILCAVAVAAAMVSLLSGVRLAAMQEPPQGLRWLCALAGGIALLSLRKAITGTSAPETFGTAGFAEPQEETELLVVPHGQTLPKGAVFLGCARKGHQVAVPRALALRHGCIVGGSGSGKSYSFFLPNAALACGISCVFADPKSELWYRTSGLHPEAVRYAPDDPDHSEAFNWVPLCRDARIAETLARAIMESGNTRHTDQAFLDMETAFLAALFAHASTLPEPTPLTAYRLFTAQDGERLMQQLIASASPVAREQARVFEQTHDRLRGSIVPVVAARLQFLRDPQVARFTSATLLPPDFRALRRSPQALYWCLREQDIARLRPLTSAFFTLLFEQLAAQDMADTDTQTSPDTTSFADGCIPVTAFLDEFATLGVLPHFETTIAVARGRNLSLWLGLQSLAQLEARYGKPNAQIILANCATKIALSGLDLEAAEYVSRALGQATIISHRRSWSRPRWRLFGSSVTEGPSEHPRPLLTADEVRRLPPEQMLAVIGSRRPLRLWRRRYEAPACAAKATRLGPARACSCGLDNPQTPSRLNSPEKTGATRNRQEPESKNAESAACACTPLLTEPPPLPAEMTQKEDRSPGKSKKRGPPRRVTVLSRTDGR